MYHVILFGGGDGGGLIITEHGIKRIPPFDPGVLRQVEALGEFARLEATLGERGLRGDVSKLAVKQAEAVFADVAKIVGGSVGDFSLSYLDDDVPFCGTTGPHHVIPLPRPRPEPVGPRFAGHFDVAVARIESV